LSVDTIGYDTIKNESQIYKVGVFAKIVSILSIGQGVQLMLMAHRRITLNEFTTFGPPSLAKVTHWKKLNNYDPNSSLLRSNF
jgi:ATP-dependent Lon protease